MYKRPISAAFPDGDVRVRREFAVDNVRHLDEIADFLDSGSLKMHDLSVNVRQ
jgi:hypothetical protein